MSRLRTNEIATLDNTKVVLVEDLAGIFEADGAGLIPYDENLVYPPGSIGEEVKSIRTDLFDPTLGASLVRTQQSATGFVPRTVESKLREIVTRQDFNSDVNFDAAKVGKFSIDGANNIAASVLPTGGGAAIPLADTARDAQLSVAGQFAQGPRDALRYGSATSVLFHSTNTTMGEFRFRGTFTGGRGRVLPLSTKTASTAPAGLGAESSFRSENWYAAFAVANAIDSAANIKTMPFLRVGSVAGSVVTLNKAGEGIHTVQAQTYAWLSGNNLAGVKCLVISEGGGWSGRITTITANTSTTVTLNAIGSLGFGDYLLPAPPGFTEFSYLGSFYMDTAEVRNIYDSGSIVKSKGIFVQSPSTNGSIPAPGVQIDCAGYICPLATAVILDSSANMSTASTGDVAEYFDVDGGNHIVQTGYVVKSISTSATYIFDGITVPFLYPWRFNYANAGALVVARVSSQLNMTGWIEP